MSLFCRYCGRQIDPKKVAAYRKYPPQFCNRDCFLAWRKARGFYVRFSGLGLDAQRKMAKETGERPGNDKRRAVLDRVRHLSHRRLGKSHQDR